MKSNLAKSVQARLLNYSRQKRINSEVCQIPGSDGLVFSPGEIKLSEIREVEIYQGMRVRIPAHLGSIRLIVSVDVGFGDVIIPESHWVDYPVLIDLPSPKIMAYPKETVVAEKFDAILQLGLRNSRMKDYYDLWVLVSLFTFDFEVLQEAVFSTLKRRGRTIEIPIVSGLTDEFASNPVKDKQWQAFLKRVVPECGDIELVDIVTKLRKFFSPVIVNNHKSRVSATWSDTCGWATNSNDSEQ